MSNLSFKHDLIVVLCLQRSGTGSVRTAEGVTLGPAVHTVCSCASPSPCPAVGLLCDGPWRKGIGGTFHTLGAAWWGVGSGLMNGVHLAETRGPQASLVQTRFADQSGGNPCFIQSHTPPTPSPPWSPRSVSSPRLLPLRSLSPLHLILSPMLELPVSPDAHGEP